MLLRLYQAACSECAHASMLSSVRQAHCIIPVMAKLCRQLDWVQNLGMSVGLFL